jgi:hypothetical protein
MISENQIEKVKQLLTEWNPLGERSVEISDLNNYQTEAVDILFLLNKKSSVAYINKLMVKVLAEAFNLEIDLNESYTYAEKLREIINE